MELRGETGEGFRWRGEAMAGAGGGGFKSCGGEDAKGAGVAGGEMLLDSLLFGGWKFSVDEGAELVGSEVVRVERFDCRIGLGRLIHRDSPRCGCRS
jgi:hypothetical protein